MFKPTGFSSFLSLAVFIWILSKAKFVTDNRTEFQKSTILTEIHRHQFWSPPYKKGIKLLKECAKEGNKDGEGPWGKVVCGVA